MADRFTLEIELGNEAMQTGGDVADVLRHVSRLLDEGYTSGPLYDRNGNAVGSWTFDAAEIVAGGPDDPAYHRELR